MTPRLANADTSARNDRTRDEPVTRFPNLWRLLTGQDPLSDAQQARQHARKAVEEAESRNDDRDLGRARMILSEATRQELIAAVRR